MGGVKKKSISQMAKQQERESMEKKEEKREERREKKPLKSFKEFFDENEVDKALKELKVITPNSLASQLNIRVGAAKRILANLERKGQVRLVAGSSRLRIYSLG
jgi:ribosomal protein S25